MKKNLKNYINYYFVLYQWYLQPFIRVIALWEKVYNQIFQHLVDIGCELTTKPENPSQHFGCPDKEHP